MNNYVDLATTELSINEPRETVKGILENLKAINRETQNELRMIADAIIDGKHPAETSIEEEPVTMVEMLQQEREIAEKNLKNLIRIREILW